MDLLTGLYTGRESLMSHGTALAAVADNVANTNTTGYKAERPEFAALLADSMGGLYSQTNSYGNGVEITDINTIHAQGPLEVTNRSLDFSIQGEGFFIVSNGTDTYYTRAGNFTAAADGTLVTQDGLTVMGYASGDLQNLVPLQVENTTVQAQATTTVALNGVLDSRSTITTAPTNPQTFGELNSAASAHGIFSVIDALGEKHDIDMYFSKTDATTWQASAYVDGSDVGGTAGVPVQVGSATMNFPNNGSPAVDSTITMTMNPAWPGTTSSPVTIDMTQFQSVAAPSVLSGIIADGTQPGTVSNISLSKDGTIVGQLDSGAQTTLGTIALARFVNPESLTREGSNMFSISEKTSTPSVGTPNTEARGSVSNNSLENSTVDQANEFINVVRYQRGYQAGSQIVRTMNELLNTTLQLA
ncbi:MAG: flagellar hook-basal body complex protein [Deltaproteobacteria bacterium]|nr:flagellar hook-basal body complex protein [Deltaproteobacteria bacterium]